MGSSKCINCAASSRGSSRGPSGETPTTGIAPVVDQGLRTAEANVDQLLSSLEAVPTSSLREYRPRLRELLARFDSTESALSRALNHVDVLSLILSFNDMLAAVDDDIPSCLDKLVDGSRSSTFPKLKTWVSSEMKFSPAPWFYDRVETVKARLRELASSILVCKLWCRLNSVENSRAAIAKAQNQVFQRRMASIRSIASDAGVPWVDRLCALAAANDVEQLKENFGPSNVAVSASTAPGLFAALKEMDALAYCSYDGDGREDEATRSLNEARKAEVTSRRMSSDLFADFDEIDHFEFEKEDLLDPFLSVCAVNAACAGSVNALRFLRSWSVSSLWNCAYDQKCFAPGLVIAIDFSCHSKYLEAPLRGISEFIHGSHYRDLHERIYGSSGNILHHAAASNHKGLVQVLLRAGMRPSFSLPDMDDRSDRRKRTFAPSQWAENRGYFEVAKLLDAGHSLNGTSRVPRLIVRGPHATPDVMFGQLVHFDVDKGFGFIEKISQSEPSECSDDYTFDDDVFVHITTLRDAMAFDSRLSSRELFPPPGLELAFLARSDPRGRGMKATCVACMSDGCAFDAEFWLDRSTAGRDWAYFRLDDESFPPFL